MKTYLFITFSIVLLSCSSRKVDIHSPKIDVLISEIQAIGAMPDSPKKEAKLTTFWDSLSQHSLIPFTDESSVLFLYRGEANSVHFNGDFNNWSNDKSFNDEAELIKGTDIWMLPHHFPIDARLDYKVTINNEEWILDPDNLNQQWSGFGPNSELRMPKWKEEPLTKSVDNIEKGVLSEHIFIDSKNLDYQVQFRVYTPSGYDDLSELPVLYITDGQEYSNEKLGAVPIVMDNLIHSEQITPVIAVFVEPLNPDNLNENRRMDEMGMNENFLSFFVDELIPYIESNYSVSDSKDQRAILGTSLGGLNATYFGFSRPDVFGKIAIQSPAYWYREQIFQLVENYSNDAPTLFMSVGTIGDGTEDARKMKAIFDEKGLVVNYIEVNEGHSWGAWRSQIDDLLIQFFGS